MSLADVLARETVDKSLDDIFKSSAGPSTIITTRSATTQKRKTDGLPDEKIAKKVRALDNAPKGNRRNKQEGKGKAKEEESSEEDNEHSGISEMSSDEDEATSTVIVHESTKKSNKQKKRSRKEKYVPEGETREQRDARTIFIGNLPVAVVKSKPLKKQLSRHILSHVPSAKIESIRFRSIAFRNPTSALADEEDEKSSKQKHSQKRAAEWRAEQAHTDGPLERDKEEAEEEKKGEKKYMTPAEKRRLAAIKGELHEHSSATTNAYVVFAYPIPTSADVKETRASSREVMDPFAAAREAVRKLHETFFADHMLRVDLAGKPNETAQGLDQISGALTDPRLSIFVGNLDFASNEDDIRAFFEKVMHEERGKPDAGAAGDEDEDGESAPATLRRPTWVTRVRIVRDRETQLGKGFAYVQFADRDCIDEVLALEPEKLKFSKRTLRVQRCKTLPSLAARKVESPHLAVKPAPPTAKSKSRQQGATASLAKGDPTLGTRLAGLSKEERKKAKAADPTRLARRLAKKKARMELGEVEKPQKRLRERKDKKSKGAVNTGRKEKNKRERSERHLQRKNVKK